MFVTLFQTEHALVGMAFVTLLVESMGMFKFDSVQFWQ